MANLKIGTIGLGRLGYHHTKNVTRIIWRGIG